MSAVIQNILTLAQRDLTAGRYADAEAEYAKVLEIDADQYFALHRRGLAHTWRSTLLEGNPIAVIECTDAALKLCRETGGDEADFMDTISFDIINLTSRKYNELTRIFNSIARGENRTAPSPLFFNTWSVTRPDGLSLSDVSIPMINYLAAIIMVSEYLDRLLESRKEMEVRRLHNVGNLAVFYDWLLTFESTGRVNPDYLRDIQTKREKLAALQDQLEEATDSPDYQNAPSHFPEGRPLPGLAIDADREKKVAHFPLRPPFEVICPVCGTIQKANRSLCYQCSCRFIFDDDVK